MLVKSVLSIAEGVEVGEVEVGGAMLEDLVVGELVEDDPDQQRMLARRLWWPAHAAVISFGAGFHVATQRSCAMLQNAKMTRDAADGAADAHQAAVPLGKAQQKQEQNAGPDDQEDQ